MRILSLTAAIILAAFTPNAAMAHAKMHKSVPAAGETVAAGLTNIEINFSKPMRLTLVNLTIGEAKTAVKATNELPASFVTSAAINCDPLAAGAYTLTWTGVGKDGHVMSGNFSFTVEKSAPGAPAQ